MSVMKNVWKDLFGQSDAQAEVPASAASAAPPPAAPAPSADPFSAIGGAFANALGALTGAPSVQMNALASTPPAPPPPPSTGNPVMDLLSGVWENPYARGTLTVLGVAALAGGAYYVAHEVFGVGKSADDVKGEIQEDLKNNKADVGKFKMLADKDPKVLDDLINGLPDSTSQKVYEAAIEGRFGIKVSQFDQRKVTDAKGNKTADPSKSTAIDPDLPDKSVKRIYQLLSKIPPNQVKDNPSLSKIIRFKESASGAEYGGKTVSLYVGQADNTQPYTLGDPKELLGDPKAVIDPTCLPKDAKKPDYFDFATLHEVGHAVDDKLGFMTKNQTGAAYGAWSSETPASLAKVAAAFFSYDDAAGTGQRYISNQLAKVTPNPPPSPPTGVTLAVWQAAQGKVDTWCKAIGNQKLWWDGAGTKANAIGGRVYQQAYDKTWVSYSLAARAKGISGYQFRAPAEWFAELYAAFQSNKLQDGHPAMAWLKKL